MNVFEGQVLDRVFTDKASGRDTARPQLTELLRFAQHTDAVVVHGMDRLVCTLNTAASGAPGLLAIFTGTRGIGKTVMRGAAHDAAHQEGWKDSYRKDCNEGFVGRSGESMRSLTEEPGNGPQNRRNPLSGGRFQPSLSCNLNERQVAWRKLGEELLQHLNEKGTEYGHYCGRNPARR